MVGRRSAPAGFTLIEVMMVLAIIAMLAGMVLSVVAIARRSAQVSRTISVLIQVEQGISLFREEVGFAPYRDPSSPWSGNDLARRIARTLSTPERVALRSDLVAIDDAYAWGTHRVGVAEVDAIVTIVEQREMHAGTVSRLGAERGRLGLLSGFPAIRGIASQRTVPILANPVSDGWGGDYLPREMRRYIRGNDLVDPYGTPLLYVCPVIAGVSGTSPGYPLRSGSSSETHRIRPEVYGLDPQGRQATERMDSDIRTHAGPSYVTDFECWSLGADRTAAPLRSDSANRDNVAARPYLRGLR